MAAWQLSGFEERPVGEASFRNGPIHLSKGLIRTMTEDKIMKETLRDYQINPIRF